MARELAFGDLIEDDEIFEVTSLQFTIGLKTIDNVDTYCILLCLEDGPRRIFHKMSSDCLRALIETGISVEENMLKIQKGSTKDVFGSIRH